MRDAPPSSALIFKVNQLGDNVVFLPVAQELARRKVVESLTIWTTPMAAALYEDLPQTVRVEAWPRAVFNSAWRHPARLLRLLRRTRAARPETCLVGEDQGNTAHLLALLSGAKTRIGTPLPHIRIPSSITHYVEWPDATPAAEQSWALGTALAKSHDAEKWPTTPPPPDLSHLIDPSPQRRFDFLIHPGASLEYKRWPLARFAELARKLAQSHSVGWIHALPDLPDFSKSRVEVLEPRNLRTFVTLLAHSAVFIGNNSGPMNLTSALGVPSLIFCGPSSSIWNPYWHADRFRLLRDNTLPCIGCDPPTGPLNRCTNQAHPLACMTYWTVENVHHIALDWLAAASQLPVVHHR